jgi:hypothetical protein
VNINICGGGRWATEILKESIKIKKIKNINVITSNDTLSKKYYSKKKIKFYKKVNNKLIKLKYKTIICNKLANHISSAKFFLKGKSKVLIEKPVFRSRSELKKIIRYKNRIHFSKILSFNSQVVSFIKKIKKKNFLEAKIIWFDKLDEKRRGIKKRHDKNISFLYDTMHHVINFLELIFGENKKFYNLKNIKFQKSNFNETNFSFNFGNCLFKCYLSRIKKNRKRLLILDTYEKKYFLDFGKTNNWKKNTLTSIHLPYYERNDSLRKMINYFISNNLKNNKLSYSNSINYIKIYKNLFK